jgi:hypothetical protein
MTAMIYFPLLVFIAVTIWIAGWRKALEIIGLSLLVCLIFGIGFNILLPVSILPRLGLLIAVAGGYFYWRKRQHAI